MRRRTTTDLRKATDLEQREEGKHEVRPGLPQTATRSLVVIPTAQLATARPPAPLVTTHKRTLVAHSAPTTRCPCPRCRKRRARKKGGRARKQQAPYIEATIITVTPWTDEPGRAGASPTPNGPDDQPTWTKQPPDQSGRRKRFSLTQACLVVAVLVALLWVSGLGDRIGAYLFPPSPEAHIAIIPASSRVSLGISITAVTGPPGANQVAARVLQGSSPLRTVVARATGSGQTPAQPAQGTLIFYNQGPSPQTIGAGVSLTGADGIVVVTLASVTVPGGNPPTLGTAEVSAQSVLAGSRANIAAGDINNLCCAAGISVKNTAFAGGQDAQTYPVLKQQDIDTATATVAQALTQQAQARLAGQVSGSEQLAPGPQCHTSVAAASPAGSHVSQATIGVAAACTGEAFDRVGARRVAIALYTQAATKQLGQPYTLASSVATTVTQASLADARRGMLIVSVQAQATWRYQWSSAELQAIARRIRGKSVQAALSMLAEAPGVAHASISLTGGAQGVPSDPARISIVILPIPGSPAS
jgi:hypothetical protein